MHPAIFPGPVGQPITTTHGSYGNPSSSFLPEMQVPLLPRVSNPTALAPSKFALSSISGKLIWLRASAVTGLADGATCPYTSILDQSGKGNNPTALSEPANASTVVYKASIGGQPAIQFGSSGVTCPSVLPAATSHTKAAVVQFTGSPAGSIWGSTGNGHNLRFTAATTIRIRYNSNTYDTTVPSVSAGQTVFVLYSYDSNLQILTLWLNGAVVGRVTGVTGGADSTLQAGDNTSSIPLAGYWFDGFVLDHAITPDEVTAATLLYNATYGFVS